MSEYEGAGATGRKPYVRPRLEVHGTLRNLTAAVGNSGATDGGIMLAQTKTSV